MEQYKTDAEIYAVLEREIIDLTIRPGSSLSENPLCARFGAPRTLIRVVLLALTNWVKPTKNLHPIVFIAASAVVGVVFRFAGV